MTSLLVHGLTQSSFIDGWILGLGLLDSGAHDVSLYRGYVIVLQHVPGNRNAVPQTCTSQEYAPSGRWAIVVGGTHFQVFLANAEPWNSVVGTTWMTRSCC